MNTGASSRTPRIILAVCLCVLGVAAATRPLSPTRSALAPQLNQLHQGLERHIFFEVSAGGSHTPALYDLLIRRDLPLIAATQQQSFRIVSARQPDNWPIVFSLAYRHIPPSKSGDSDLFHVPSFASVTSLA